MCPGLPSRQVRSSIHPALEAVRCLSWRPMRLLLIRHGQTPANVLGQLDTARPGPGFTPLGERQAAMTPRALRERQIAAVAAEVDSTPPAVMPSVLPSGLPSASPSVPRSGRASGQASGRASGIAPGGTVDDSASPYTAAAFSHRAAIRVWTAARAHNVPPPSPGPTNSTTPVSWSCPDRLLTAGVSSPGPSSRWWPAARRPAGRRPDRRTALALSATRTRRPHSRPPTG